MALIRVLILTITIMMAQLIGLKRIDYEKGRYKNVCKELKSNVLIYFIFVDSKETSPWTTFDIQSTIDSVKVAVRWLNEQAQKHNVNLVLKTDYYIGDDYATIKKNLPFGTVEQSVLEPNFKNGLEALNDWADNIAKKAGSSFYITEKDGIPEIKNPKNKERLVAFLRDDNNVESVALVYFVNNYFKTDISIPVNILDDDDVEFSIVSYKYPSEITHNILHLFGAADLYETPYRRLENKVKMLKEEFPNDIMQDVYARSLNELEIGPYTRYLIGWEDKLDSKYESLLTDKFVSF